MLEYIKDPKKVICSDGIVRVITGERSRRMTVLAEEELPITLEDCLTVAKVLGYDEAHPTDIVLVIAEDYTEGKIYKYGNHQNPQTKRPCWELVGETSGIA